ncbi:DUF2069 domain-containing protein [Chitinimonas viridis]|uniref:DUF2069 domain-containing protein n=1 Tax=Chitinimonas viridis TaxID=664880 RepID=A0ABT8B187_9NEIS|nr:DUF2069 domain-containing protein [Chitinimonas viridis]MDN3575775.1 DUF2069 domain-containing protein [Chitinimonas viridis]
MNPWIRLSRNGTLAGMLALFILCIVWEAWLAPLRPGSLLWIKALPLLLPLPGVLRGKRYTYQWLSMYVLAWFIEGVMRSWGDRGTMQYLALVETFLSVWVFCCTVVYARLTRPTPQ